MKTDLTEIVFILDRSGSMGGLEEDTIGGYNAFLNAQRETEGEAQVTTILFDDHYEILHNGVDLRRVKPITATEYFVRGSTALLDAVGKTILKVGHRLARTPEDVRPAKVVFVITTDGMENSSREFTFQKIKDMITHQQEKYSWEFIFLGANIDAESTAGQIGIHPDQAATYTADAEGTEAVYESMARNISMLRNQGMMETDWKQKMQDEREAKKRK